MGLAPQKTSISWFIVMGKIICSRLPESLGEPSCHLRHTLDDSNCCEIFPLLSKKGAVFKLSSANMKMSVEMW